MTSFSIRLQGLQVSLYLPWPRLSCCRRRSPSDPAPGPPGAPVPEPVPEARAPSDPGQNTTADTATQRNFADPIDPGHADRDAQRNFADPIDPGHADRANGGRSTRRWRYDFSEAIGPRPKSRQRVASASASQSSQTCGFECECEIVFIAGGLTGYRYHRKEGCSGARVPVLMSRAQQLRFTLCSKCG